MLGDSGNKGSTGWSGWVAEGCVLRILTEQFHQWKSFCCCCCSGWVFDFCLKSKTTWAPLYLRMEQAGNLVFKHYQDSQNNSLCSHQFPTLGVVIPSGPEWVERDTRCFLPYFLNSRTSTLYSAIQSFFPSPVGLYLVVGVAEWLSLPLSHCPCVSVVVTGQWQALNFQKG